MKAPLEVWAVEIPSTETAVTFFTVCSHHAPQMVNAPYAEYSLDLFGLGAFRVGLRSVVAAVLARKPTCVLCPNRDGDVSRWSLPASELPVVRLMRGDLEEGSA